MKVALYCRVSTEKQEDQKTIDSQIAALEAYAREKGYIIVERYIDNGYSGTLLARPELDRLRDDAAKGVFEAVIIHSPDRLARRYVWQEVVIEELKTKEIQTIFLNRPIAATPEDQLLLGMQGLIAEFERTKFLERTRRGRLHRAKSGHILGNIPPYGYKCIKKADSVTGYAHYLINEDEAHIVRLMFNLLITNHMTTYGIIVELNNQGIKARNGKRWAKSSVAKILRNQTYTGVTFYNKNFGIPSPNKNNCNEAKYHRRKNTTFRLRPKDEWIAIENIPAIISNEEFLAAQEQLNNNSRFSSRNTKQSYLIQGLLKCGKDNRSFTGVPMHGKPFYRCSGKSKLVSEICCESSSISSGIVEPIVWNSIVELVNNPEIILQQLRKRQKANTVKLVNVHDQIKHVEKLQEKLQIEETRIIEAYSQQVLTLDQLKPQTKRIKGEQQQLETQKKNLTFHLSQNKTNNSTIKNVKIYLENFKKALETFNFAEKQAFLREILKEIVINDRKLFIRGILPANVNLCPQPTAKRTSRCRKNSIS